MQGRLTYANVTATLALFLVVSGGAAIAARLDRDSVGARELKPDSIRSKELKNGAAVQSADVIDDSLLGRDIRESTLGAVPNADRAEVSGFADSAGVAASANSAVSAERAANATQASNTSQLQGRGLAGVIPAVAGDSVDHNPDTALNVGPETEAVDVDLPVNVSSTVAGTATVQLVSSTASGEATCQMRVNQSGVIFPPLGQTYTAEFSFSGQRIELSLGGVLANVEPGTRRAFVNCTEVSANVAIDRAGIVVEAIPGA